MVAAAAGCCCCLRLAWVLSDTSHQIRYESCTRHRTEPTKSTPPVARTRKYDLMHYYIVLVRIHSSSSSDSWRYCGTATKAVPVALDCGCACYNTSVCFFLPHVLLDNSLTTYEVGTVYDTSGSRYGNSNASSSSSKGRGCC